jgi:hypothetical protein
MPIRGPDPMPIDKRYRRHKSLRKIFVVDAGLTGDLARADAEIRRGDGIPQKEVFERSGV